MELNKRSTLGRRLTYRETDENWTKLEQQSEKSFTTTATLVVGENIVEHGKESKARFVNFFKSDGTPTDYYWVRAAAPDDVNKIIVTVPAETPEEELTDTEINIQCI